MENIGGIPGTKSFLDVFTGKIKDATQLLKPKNFNNPTEQTIQNMVSQEEEQSQQPPGEVYNEERFFRHIHMVQDREKVDTVTAGKMVMENYKSRNITVDGLSYDEVMNTYRPEEFMQDLSIIQEDKGISYDEAFKKTVEDYIEKGYSVDGYNLQAEMKQILKEEKQKEDLQIEKETEGFGKFGRFIESGLEGALSATPKILGNISGFTADLVDNIPAYSYPGFLNELAKKGMSVNDSGHKDLGDFLRSQGEEASNLTNDFIKQGGTYKTQSDLGRKTGEFIGELAFGVKGLDKLTKIQQLKVGKLATEMPGGASTINLMRKKGPSFGVKYPKFSKIVGKTLKNSGIGAKEMAKFGIVSEGTPEETIKQAGIGAVGTPLITGAFKVPGAVSQGFKNLTKTTPVRGETLDTTISKRIFQPSIGMVDYIADGVKGLGSFVNRRKNVNIGTFKDLELALGQEANKVFRPLIKGLEQANKKVKPVKDSSVQGALEDLSIALESKRSKSSKLLKQEVDTLLTKHNKDGLDLLEIQKVKKLHTQNNKLFTDRGAELKGFTAQEAQAIRKDIKEVIEDLAEKGGFMNVKKINSEYGNYQTAINLVEQQTRRLGSKSSKMETETIMNKIGNLIGNLPGVTSTRELVRSALLLNGQRTINVVDVEQNLPKLLEQLKGLGLSKKTINGVKRFVDNEVDKILKAIPENENVSKLIKELQALRLGGEVVSSGPRNAAIQTQRVGSELGD